MGQIFVAFSEYLNFSNSVALLWKDLANKVMQTSGIVIMFSFVFWQMYIGLVIGILGVTVVLLVVTIVVMMRRNKQKIFNKVIYQGVLSSRRVQLDLWHNKFY